MGVIMFWIYGKDNCKFCEAAKLLLHTKNLPFAYIDVGVNPEWRDPSWKKVPQIFYVAHHIGGYMALEHYLENEYESA